MTVKGDLPILTLWPIGFVSPKRLVATVWPMTATRFLASRSRAVKNEPFCISRLRTCRYSGVVPVTDDVQFWLLATSW